MFFVIPYWRVIKRMRLHFHSKKICANTPDALNDEYFAQFYLSCALSFHALTKALSRATMKCALNKKHVLISDVRLITRQYGI